MSRICSVCEKRPRVANIVSHANNKTKKWVYPNVQPMRFSLVGGDGSVERGKVCTKCIKGRKVQRIL